MANEIRTRFNLVSGSLTSGISDTDTSISSAGLANLGVIDSTNYAAIIIGTEIMWVTAHSAAATTATVVRHKEGTTAVAHGTDATWVHGPTVLDIEDGGWQAGDIVSSSRNGKGASWLLCDGDQYSATTYPALAAQWGTGAGSRHGPAAAGAFTVPDMRGAFPIGKRAAGALSTLGQTGGVANGVSVQHGHTIGDTGHGHTLDGVAAHHHTSINTQGGSVNLTPGASSYPIQPTTIDTGDAGAHGHTLHNGATGITVGPDGPSPTDVNLPPCVVINYFVHV